MVVFFSEKKITDRRNECQCLKKEEKNSRKYELVVQKTSVSTVSLVRVCSENFAGHQTSTISPSLCASLFSTLVWLKDERKIRQKEGRKEDKKRKEDKMFTCP